MESQATQPIVLRLLAERLNDELGEADMLAWKDPAVSAQLRALIGTSMLLSCCLVDELEDPLEP